MKRRLIPVLLIAVGVVALVAAIGGSKVQAQDKKVDQAAARLVESNRILAKVTGAVAGKAAGLGLTEYMASAEFAQYLKGATALYPKENYDDFGCALERDALLPSTRADMAKVCDGWKSYVAADNLFFAQTSALALGKSTCLGVKPVRLEDRYASATVDFTPISDTIVSLAATKCAR